MNNNINNNNDNLNPIDVSNIISNFSNLVRNFSIKETEWQIQKEEYEKRISELEGEIQAHENINIDLLKRIRMLEYSLAQERQKNSSNDENNDYINNNNIKDEIDLPPQNLLKEEDLKFLRENSNRPSLLSVLKSVGIDDNLVNNLFTDFELNRNELENMIKKNIEEKLSKNTKIEQNFNNNNNNNNNPINNNINNNNYNQIINNNNNNNNNQLFSFNNFIELHSHFDEVRKLTYIQNLNSLVSVSEDCLIKIWSLNNLKFPFNNNNNYNNIDEEILPYLTLRGHTGPLYCTEHGKNNLIYTGGNEGLIQIWSIDPENEIDFYGNPEKLFNMNVGFFQTESENSEIIWDLKHHPIENLLISLSSDGNINFWETTTKEEFIKNFTNEKFDKWLKFTKNKQSNYIDEISIPTICDFLPVDNNKLIVGFNDCSLSIFDINQLNFESNFNILNNQNVINSNYKNYKIYYQPNCFACCTKSKVIYIGCEDNTIKTIDLNQKKNINNNNNNDFIVNNLNAHNDAVTGLSLYNDNYLFSVSHDTTIKMWDTRKMNDAVITTVSSQKKWDEAMLDCYLIENSMILAVACADCSVKLYKLS